MKTQLKRVVVLLKPDEYVQVKQAAGLVPLSAYIRWQLMRHFPPLLGDAEIEKFKQDYGPDSEMARKAAKQQACKHGARIGFCKHGCEK